MRRTNVSHTPISRRTFCASTFGALASAASVLAQSPTPPGTQLVEPVYRVSKAKVDHTAVAPKHPLDPALALAYDGLRNIRENVRDYTATLVKRERIGDELQEREYMFTKIRNEKSVDGQVVTPFAVYLYFLKPDPMKGREVIFVRGQNNNKMIAHERRDSLKGKFGSVWLKPDGPIAMQGNRYPITEIGLETLVVRLIEKGTRDKQNGTPEECQVQFNRNATINGRVCTMLQVLHPVPRDYFDFHIAQIFIDDEYNVPVRYAAYSWPSRAGGGPELIEEYTYLSLKLNAGCPDADFDHNNPEYNF